MHKRLFLIALLLLTLLFTLMATQKVSSIALNTTRLHEASGLAHSLIYPDILYSHNDSGGEASVFALDTEGKLVAEIKIPSLHNRDWEDLATALDPESGEAYIYIGEIGDNNARYPSIAVHRIPEPALTRADSVIFSASVQSYQIEYEDGARDAEALFVEPGSGDIYILSKREERVGIYLVPYPQSSSEINAAQRLGEMDMGWVTAADISPDNKYILVKNYPSIRRFNKGQRRSVHEALSRTGKSMQYQLEPQGEGICFDAKGKGYYTLSEAVPEEPQVLYYYQ
ncbi:MAG: hypothetical protein PWP64_252 [Candidatus Cloacimonadota bacterium]|nr:hypothetical protein [Candidatus Cloacimonadota bacterium]